MNVIPAIDLLNGNVVRLQKGDYTKVTIYSTDPVSLAAGFKEAGFNRIHIVDLNGARDGTFTNLGIIEKIISGTGLSVQTGGGVRSFEDVSMLIDRGIQKVVCSSMAVQRETDWFRALKAFGGDRCVLGMDLKNGQIAISGWLETTEEPVDAFLERHIGQGLREVLCTDISRDGMLTGANIPLYAGLIKTWPMLDFIASGGVKGETDLEQLAKLEVYAVVVGRAYFENLISLESMKKWNNVHFY